MSTLRGWIHATKRIVSFRRPQYRVFAGFLGAVLTPTSKCPKVCDNSHFAVKKSLGSIVPRFDCHGCRVVVPQDFRICPN